MPSMSPTLPQPAPLRLQSSSAAAATGSVSRTPDEQDTDYPDRPPVSPISPVIPFAAPVEAVPLSQTSSPRGSSPTQQPQPASHPQSAHPQFPGRYDQQHKQQQQRQPLPQSNFTFQFQAQQLHKNPDARQNGNSVNSTQASNSAIPPSASYNRAQPYNTASPISEQLARQQPNYLHQQQPQQRLPPTTQQHQWQHLPQYHQQPQHQASTAGSLPTLHTQPQIQSQTQTPPQAHPHVRKAQPKDSSPKTASTMHQQPSHNPATTASSAPLATNSTTPVPVLQSQPTQQSQTAQPAQVAQPTQPTHSTPAVSTQPSTSSSATTTTQPPTTDTPPTFIPSPSLVPISESTNPDALALRSAISILQIQRQKALRDITALQSLKTRAGADPSAFRDALVRGDLKHERSTPDPLGATFQSDLDSDDEEESDEVEPTARENGQGTEKIPNGESVVNREKSGEDVEDGESTRKGEAMEIDAKWPAIPVPQNVVRCPPVNWNKYHVAGEVLDRLHEERRRRPDPNGREHAVAARYDPFVDLLEGQTPHGHGRRGSGAAGSEAGTLG